jgi:argininosuccinate lyase
MPQKKNPDIPELIRGKTGRAYGHLVSLLTTMKGLPLTYNKDMQEDKEALFDTVDTVQGCLFVMARMLKEVSFDEEKMRGATEKGCLVATDLADYLVLKGLTFRQAHEITGKLVLLAMDRKMELHQIPLKEMRAFSRQIEEDVYEWLDPEGCIKRRNLPGGTGPDSVRQNLERIKKEMES